MAPYKFAPQATSITPIHKYVDDLMLFLLLIIEI